MNDVIIIYQPYVPATLVAAQRLADYLHGRRNGHQLLSAHELAGTPSQPVRLAICFGGDGTALRSARWLSSVRAPVVPVRMGKLSFLGELDADKLPEASDPYLAGDFWLDERAMLTVSRGTQHWTALNDVVLARGESPRAVSIEVEVDGAQLITYLADGVIVSTATGSTAYSLAAGGPVVAPELRTLVLTPIVPHLTPLRSLVLPETARVRLANRGYAAVVLTADGQMDVPVEAGGAVDVVLAKETSLFARRGSRSDFYRYLSEKLTPAVSSMLVELTIRDFAIIDRLTVQWQPGLNVLTGETGAGKSIIVDAVGALLGDRLGAEVVRAGSERAIVEGVFELRTDEPEAGPVREILVEHGLLDQDEPQLILVREVARSGRSIGRVNGRAVPISLLQQIGENLVDIHGQSQHLSLLRVREHLEFVDRFAGVSAARRELASLVGRWRATQAERKKLLEEIRAAARERDLLRHEIGEIEAANLTVGEEEELAQLRQRLRNVDRLRRAAEQALLSLHGLDELRGAVDLLGEAALLCTDASRSDPALTESAQTLERLSAEADEVARDLRRYLEGLESDPRQLEDVEARFLTVAELKRKYGDAVESILSYLDQARRRLATAERGEELLTELDAAEQELRRQIAGAAQTISERRQQASVELASAVERELKDLNLAGARFTVVISQQPDPHGIEWNQGELAGQRVAVDSSGADRVEFLFSANRGEPPRGLGRIASGGELARVSLAMKAVLARVDQRGTLIFDEVDVGVGGRSASVVGQKLWDLTRTHQVLCITHMPQVAAFADQHLVVAKRMQAETTSTTVQPLAAGDRAEELAAMLGGSAESAAALANARELIVRSDTWKRSRLERRRAG